MSGLLEGIKLAESTKGALKPLSPVKPPKPNVPIKSGTTKNVNPAK